jgi:uncharacterized membrane protein
MKRNIVCAKIIKISYSYIKDGKKTIVFWFGMIVMIISAIMMDRYKKYDRDFNISAAFLGVGLLIMFIASAMPYEGTANNEWSDLINPSSHSNNKSRYELNLFGHQFTK